MATVVNTDGLVKQDLKPYERILAMNDQELREYQEKERTEKENVWKADAQKKESDNHDKAIKDNIVREQKALLEAHKKEAERVKSLNEKAKEKPREQRYNPVYDRAGMEREQWRQQQQQKQHQQPRAPRHHDRQGEDGMTRELNTVKQNMCKKEATQRLDKMTPEQRDTLKKSFERDMEKVGDNRKLTDAGLHHKLSEKIMDDRGVPRPDHTDLAGIAAGLSKDGGSSITSTDVMLKHERERYVQPDKSQAREKGQEPRNPDHPATQPGKGPKGPDQPQPGGAPTQDPRGPDRPGPAPAHAHAHHKMPWDKNPQEAAHGHKQSKDQGQEIAQGQGKPWDRQQHADPDRSESRMAAQARAREQER